MRPVALVSLILFVASFAAAQQPGPEVPVSAPGPLVPVAANSPRLATNGSGFLGVWNDQRANGDVYATRLDASGNVLDPSGILVEHLSDGAAVASDGRDYLVAIAQGCTNVFAVRVSADGSVGDLKTIRKTTDPGLCSNVEIASNGDTYLVAWMPGSAALLDHDANLVAGPFPLGVGLDRIAVATNGHDYVIAGVVDSPLFPVVAIPVDAHGFVGSTRQLFVSSFSDVAIASDGNGYTVAATARNNVRVVRLSSDGTQLGVEADQVSVGTAFTPRVAWNGSQYVIGYFDATPTGNVVRFAALDPNSGTLTSGARIDSAGSPDVINGPFDMSALSGNILIAWTQGTAFAALVSGSDLLSQRQLTGKPLATAPMSQTGPMIVTNRTSTVAVWREGFSSLRGAVLSSDGRPLSNPVDIAPYEGISAYKVAFAGTTLLAAWIYNGDLYARRFTAALQPIDRDPFLIQQRVYYGPFDLAAGNGVALLTWSAPSSNTTDEGDIYAALLHTDGGIITSTPIPIAGLPFNDFAVSAAWNGSEFLVAWSHATAPTPAIIPPIPIIVPTELMAERVSSDGHVLDASPITVASFGGNTVTTSMGSNFLVAWGNGTGLYAKAIAADGTVTSEAPKQLAIAPALESPPALVPWSDRAILLWTARTLPYTYTTFFEIVDASGNPEGFTSLQAVERIYPGAASLAVTPAGIVVAYDRLAFEPQYGGVSRVFIRTVVPTKGRRRTIAH